MARFDIAHIHEQGQDMIIAFVNSAVGYKPTEDMEAIRQAIEGCANSAGLRGQAALVWDAGGGQLKFFAPSPWHPFFRSLSLFQVASSVNKYLDCDF